MMLLQQMSNKLSRDLADWEESYHYRSYIMAKDTAEDLAKDQPDAMEPWFLLGLTCLALRDTRNAEKHLKKAQEIARTKRRAFKHDIFDAIPQVIPMILEGINDRTLMSAPPVWYAWLENPDSISGVAAAHAGSVDKPLGRIEPLLNPNENRRNAPVSSYVMGELSKQLDILPVERASMQELLGKDGQIRIDSGRIKIMDDSVTIERWDPSIIKTEKINKSKIWQSKPTKGLQRVELKGDGGLSAMPPPKREFKSTAPASPQPALEQLEALPRPEAIAPPAPLAEPTPLEKPDLVAAPQALGAPTPLGDLALGTPDEVTAPDAPERPEAIESILPEKPTVNLPPRPSAEAIAAAAAAAAVAPKKPEAPPAPPKRPSKPKAKPPQPAAQQTKSQPSSNPWEKWDRELEDLVESGRPSDALRRVEEAVSKYPTSGRLAERKAQVLEAVGREKEAAKAYVEAFQKATVAGTDERAERAFNKAKDLAKENGDLLFDLAAVAASVGMIPFAISAGKLAADIHRRRDDRPELTKVLKQLSEWDSSDNAIKAELEKLGSQISQVFQQKLDQATDEAKDRLDTGRPQAQPAPKEYQRAATPPKSSNLPLPPPPARSAPPISNQGPPKPTYSVGNSSPSKSSYGEGSDSPRRVTMEELRDRVKDFQSRQPEKSDEMPIDFDFGTFMVIGSILVLLIGLLSSSPFLPLIGIIIIHIVKKNTPADSKALKSINIAYTIAIVGFGLSICSGGFT